MSTRQARTGEAAAALAVAVMLGSVSVEYQGKTYTIGAGARQTFAAERREREGFGREKGKNGDGEREARERREGEKKRETRESEGVTVTSGKSQTAEGTVVRGGETLVLRAANGEEMTFNVKTVKRGDDKKRDPMPDIALRKTLRPGMKVGVSWSPGEDGKKYIDKLSAGGTVTGVVVAPREKGVLFVKVDGIDGPMRFVSRWIQGGGQWIPDPKEVELIASFKTGDRVSVTYEMEEHLRINKIVAAGGADATW